MKTRRGNCQEWFEPALSAVSVLLLILECALAASGQAQLCLPQVTGLPVRSGSPPTWTFPNNPPQIPGTSCTGSACPINPEGDTGWFNAFRYTLQAGTNEGSAPTDGVFQAITQNSLLYFSFEINNVSGATGSTAYDNVILAFDNRGPSQSPPVAQQYTWVVIHGPFKATPPPNNNPQGLPGNYISYWTSSDAITWTGPGTSPPWIKAGTSGAMAGSSYSWWVVLSIDNSFTQLPPSGLFRIYLEAIRADYNTLSDNQNAFPAGGMLVGTTAGTAGNPSPSTWANATLSGGSCTGVFITSSDITNTIGGTPTDLISFTNPNTFQVTFHNSGAAVGVPGTGVQGTFKIANFGLPAPNEWRPIGTSICGLTPQPMPDCTGATPPYTNDSVTNNPTSPAPIAAAVTTPTGSCNDGTGNQCVTVQASAWTLGADNKIYYNYGDNQHECVRVDLDSTVPNTTFINNSAWNNFEFSASASQFTGPATVSAQYDPVGAGNQQTFQLHVSKQSMTAGAVQAALFKVSRKTAISVENNTTYLSFLVDGCRVTGKTLTEPVLNADGRPTGQTVTFQNCDSVGSYGYLIRHDGPAETWNYNLAASGNGVSMVPSAKDPDTYTLAIPQGQKAQLVSVVTPVPPGGKNCSKLPGGATALFTLGAIFVVGLVVYRPRKREESEI